MIIMTLVAMPRTSFEKSMNSVVTPLAMAVVAPFVDNGVAASSFPEDLPPALDYNKKMMIWSSDKDRP
jgi:hypothetical protein